MANTRQSTKRARQTTRRKSRNQIIRTTTKTSIKRVLEVFSDAIKKNENLDLAKAAYTQAVKALSKAASKGAIPAGRAARKISRLTHFIKKTLPNILPFEIK